MGNNCCTKESGTARVETTLGMIKPEGLNRGLVTEIKQRITAAGLTIEEERQIILTPNQVEMIYGNAKRDVPQIYAPMEKYLTTNPSIILRITGVDAVERLSELRGNSDASKALPGTIRGDLAKDQGYDVHYPPGEFAKNVFHAPDSEDDAERDLALFLQRKDSFYYSRSAWLFIALKPLKIDARVKEAAERANIELHWDDEGKINFIDFDDSRMLLKALGSQMLTPGEYWRAYEDALEENNEPVLRSLTSDRYCERLDRVYRRDGTFIDNPEIVGRYKYEGTARKSECPKGEPGWFNPEGNINNETAEPLHVELNREKFATSWKYWSPKIGLIHVEAVVPIRGYVTSVGKPSYDMGMPAEVKHPPLVIRECRREPLTPVIDARILSRAEVLASFGRRERLISFLETHGELFSESRDTSLYKLRERFTDLLGDAALSCDITDAAQKLHGVAGKELTYEDFHAFVSGSRHELEEALKGNKNIVFVMGHKNPDTDTVVSSLFEAWRNHLIDGKNAAYVPVVQSARMPDEISRLLKGLAGSILFATDPLYQEAKDSGLARWISVDQNREPEVQKYFISIIDHHVVSETAKNMDLPKTLEMTGSCSALITRKYLGMGLRPSGELARILYAATLMDTENRIPHKMTARDVELMDHLKKAAGIEDDNALYQDLMSHLLNTDDAEILFWRDYKEDWGFGFAEAKIKGCFSEGRVPLKAGLIDRLRDLAAKNTASKNLPLTILKITDYKEDNETVNMERAYLIFNGISSEKFKKTATKALEGIIRFAFPGDIIEVSEDHIDFYGSGMQLSRKRTAPVLQPIVAAFDRYFYSASIDRWVKRDFLKYTKEVRDACGVLSTDANGNVNYVTFPEAKGIVRKMGEEMLSISDFWRVLQDARRANDMRMAGSLTGSNFVEFWDSAIVGKSILINHPVIEEGGVSGVEMRVAVPEGNPGLIHPNDIDISTGLPKVVYAPGEYGNPELWRYWAPDADLVFPCRSFIFLLGQPSWDGKFHINESFPNLGIRPVVKEVKEPEVRIAINGAFLEVDISVEGEANRYRWPQKISDYGRY